MLKVIVNFQFKLFYFAFEFQTYYILSIFITYNHGSTQSKSTCRRGGNRFESWPKTKDFRTVPTAAMCATYIVREEGNALFHKQAQLISITQLGLLRQRLCNHWVGCLLDVT